MVYFKFDYVLWLLCLVLLSKCIYSNPLQNEKEHNLTEEILSVIEEIFETNVKMNQSAELPVDQMVASQQKLRVKRQSGAGKYTDAAQMPQVRVMRIFLQLFKNMWASSYVGGAHPLHHEIPKPVVQLYKHKIIQFFFPEVGEESKE